MSSISFLPNPAVSFTAVSNLREAVGWERLETEHPEELKGYWATLGGFDEDGTLRAWCALLSDGKYHGILLDVLVHPHWQKQGVGRALVAQAVAYLQAHSIRTIHVDFSQNERHSMSGADFASGWVAFTSHEAKQQTAIFRSHCSSPKVMEFQILSLLSSINTEWERTNFDSNPVVSSSFFVLLV